ncbi:hypothetical protein [Paenibacillus marinisediminis]
MDFTFIDLLLLAVIVYLLFMITKLEGRIKRMNYTLDQMAKEMGISDKQVNSYLRKLLQEGHEVEAVKEVRDTLGLSLVEAKQYVDALKLENK